MNLRTGHWNLPLVQRLSSLATVVKVNEHEAETLFRLTQAPRDAFTLEGFCRAWASEYRIDIICVTLGPAGCLVFDRGTILRVPAYAVTVRDTVGAGDAFAAGFLDRFAAGRPILESARFANALGALVASRAGATPPWTADEVSAILTSDHAWPHPTS
jgi:fructokinase